ncbi:F-box/kelch-repeat protein At3g23880-like [Silene latifolia]|uniref:F-box/kelch-repeat protein At3g23880-like n=1 Tax=Silene latifolia TaxID=37657 RepID=UPI003D77D7F4
MEEIFHKLPYNAMARSKLVSKEWNSIISCQKFMDDHYNYYRLIEGNHLIVLSFNSESLDSVYMSSYSNLVKEQSLTSMTIHLQNSATRERFIEPRIVGSCNGLVALFCYDKFILWNPITTKYSLVSTVECCPQSCISPYRNLYGLCYDSSTDEYSVVVLSALRIEKEIGYEYICISLYNFKDGRERALLGGSFDKRLYDAKLYNGKIGKVIHGSPHWVVNFYDYTDRFAKTDILYFDSKDELFKQMTHPGDYSVTKKLLGLAAIDDENQLGCVLHDIVSSSLEVWVMKEYGKSESWTNMFTIPYLNVTANHGLIRYMNVIGSMTSGELLFYLNGDELWIYDVEKGNRREINFEDVDFTYVITYQPTLTSPPEPLKACNTTGRRGARESSNCKLM